MTTITTPDGFVFYRQTDGTYTDGDESYTVDQIASNGRDELGPSSYWEV